MADATQPIPELAPEETLTLDKVTSSVKRYLEFFGPLRQETSPQLGVAAESMAEQPAPVELPEAAPPPGMPEADMFAGKTAADMRLTAATSALENQRRARSDLNKVR